MNDGSEKPIRRYQFASFVLDASARTLSRDGRIVHIERRALDLLEHLLENRGRLVTKDQLIDAVWQGRPVTDNAISRSVRVLREALGDSAQDPRFIVTVHGQGFRFSGQAHEVVGDDEKSRPPGLLAVAVLAALLIVVFWAVSTPDEASSEPVTVIVSPDRPTDSSPGLDLLSASINELLQQRLTEQTSLRMRRTELIAGKKDYATAASELGVDYVIHTRLDGDRSQPKQQLLITLHAIADGSRTQVGRFDLPTLDSDEGIQQFMDIREDVIRRIAGRILPAMAHDSQSVTRVRSASAYRLFLEAKDLLRRPGCDGIAPNKLLEQSLAIDPEYVPAWVQLGWAQYGLAATCGLGQKNYQLALDSVNEALQLAPDWTPAIGLRATILVETGQLELAHSTLRNAWSRTPGSADLAFFFSYVLNYAGELDRSEKWLRHALHLDEHFLVAEGWTPNVLLYQQRSADFLAAMPATQSTLFNFYRGLALAQSGNAAAAVPVLKAAYELNATDIFGRLARALVAILEADEAAAITVLDDLARQRADQSSSDGEVTFKIAQLYGMVGSTDKAMQQLMLAGEQGFLCVRCVTSDQGFRRIVGDSRYGSYIDSVRQSRAALDIPVVEP